MGPERSPDLRASDADREAVAGRLRAAATDGRLDLTEAEQRLAAAYAARTYGELEPLTADLGPAVAPPASAEPATWLREWREWAGVAVILNAIWAITSLSSGELLFYWPMFPLGIWGAVIIAGQVFGVDHRKRRRHGVHGTGHDRLHPPLPEPPRPPEPPERPRLP
jgi:hypothetical protein